MANCKECKQKRRSEQDEVAVISVFEHENEMAKMERTISRLCAALIISIILLFTLAVIKIPTGYHEKNITYEVQNDVQEIQAPQ